MWPWPFDVVLLALTAPFCLGLGMVALQRRLVPGSATFAWLTLSLVVWTGLSAVHRLPLSLDVRVLVAQFQGIGIVGVAPRHTSHRAWSGCPGRPASGLCP